jgi:hypothetical protein
LALLIAPAICTTKLSVKAAANIEIAIHLANHILCRFIFLKHIYHIINSNRTQNTGEAARKSTPNASESGHKTS